MPGKGGTRCIWLRQCSQISLAGHQTNVESHLFDLLICLHTPAQLLLMQLALPMPYSGRQLASASPADSCMLVVTDSSLASTTQPKLLQSKLLQ